MRHGSPRRTPPGTPPRSPPRSPPPRDRRDTPVEERYPDSPVDVRPAPEPRDDSNDEFGLSEDDTEAERDRQAERRRLRFRRMDEQEPRRFSRVDPAPSRAAAEPQRSSTGQRPKSPTHNSPARDAWPNEPPDDFHTPAASADEGDTSDEPATPRDRPEKKPIPPQAVVTTPRRSGRTRQPPQWYTPSPQK